MREKMKRVIVTGATGVIGTALVKKLIDNKCEILVLANEDSPRNKNIPRHPLVHMKFCSLEQLALIENDTGKHYEIFYHLAWTGTFGEKRNDLYLQNQNVKYALDAVGVAKKFGCHTFIGAGSQAEYGVTDSLLKSTTPVFPNMGYGYAKLCAGQMTRDYAAQLGLRHIWVRVLSIYGPNDGAQSMVMYSIDKLRQGMIPEYTNGEQIWDYLYSDDAAEALYLLGEKGIDKKIYVLGSGKARPLKEYIRAIRNVVAPDSDLKFGVIPYVENQTMYLCADTSELEKDVGWQATTEFSEGIKAIINNLRR